MKNSLKKYNLRGHNPKSIANNKLAISFQVIDWESLDYDPYETEEIDDYKDDNEDEEDNDRYKQWRPHEKECRCVLR